MENKELKGGRANSIFKKDNYVIRPRNSWTPSVHKYLDFLHNEGIDYIPKPVALDEKTETVTYVDGTIYHYPLPQEALSNELLKSVALLLKDYHEVSAKYLDILDGNEKWMLQSENEKEVMCHGDIAPYNMAVKDGKAVGIIDFDTVHPGARLWDVTYACYRWVPLKNPNNPDSIGSLNDQITRLSMFVETYGLSYEEKSKFVDVLILRLESLIQFMKKQAKNNDKNFEKNIEDGHLNLYLDDIKYLKNNREVITSKILSWFMTGEIICLWVIIWIKWKKRRFFIKDNDITFTFETELIDLARSVSYSGEDIKSTDINNIEILLQKYQVSSAIFNQSSKLEKYLKDKKIDFIRYKKFIILRNHEYELYKDLLAHEICNSYNYIFSAVFIISKDLKYTPFFKNRKIVIRNELAIIPYYEDGSVFIINSGYQNNND